MDLNASGWSVVGKSRSIYSVSGCWRSIGRKFLNMATSPNSAETNSNQLILLREDSPARTFQQLDSCEESKQNEADSGLSSRVWLGIFDPNTCSLRTSQGSLLMSQCAEFLETFPRSGLMRNGNVYQRRPLVPLTSAKGFGYLPTPDKSLGQMRGGIMIEADATTCFRRQTTGFRPSGARIGSSLRWHPEYINEALRTGGFVNPAWLEALMGFPENWLMLPMEHSETP